MMQDRKYIEIDVDDVLPNRFQPRIKFNETALQELAASIKEHGVIEPLVVRTLGDKYEIIAGERRYKASVIAGLKKVPAIVTDMNDKKSSEVALIENVQRQDLTPIEEAISYKKILDMGYLTQNDLATKLGKNQSTVANKLRLLDLADDVQEALLDGEISERHARSILRIQDKEKQIELLNKIIEERLTVRKTDELIKNILENKKTIISNKQSDYETVDLEGDKPLNDFNIPKEPIVENKIPNLEIENLVSNEIPNQQVNNSNLNFFEASNKVDEIVSFAPTIDDSMNPGFVNIENIEKTAEDIYKPKPLADLNELLGSTNKLNQDDSSVENDQNDAVKEEADDDFMLKPGKFFNMFNDKEDSSNNLQETSEPSLNIFDSANPISMDNNVLEPTVETVETPDFNSLFGAPVETNAPSEVLNVVSTPTESSSRPVVEDKSIENSFNYSIPTLPISEETKPDISENAKSLNSLDDGIDYSKFYEPLDDEPKEVSINEDNKDSQPIVYNNFALRNEPEIEIKPMTYQQPQKAVVDMKTVINTIRSCAETIEKYGFEIDVDEMDLENNYQVTFNIKKNN